MYILCLTELKVAVSGNGYISGRRGLVFTWESQRHKTEMDTHFEVWYHLIYSRDSCRNKCETSSDIKMNAIVIPYQPDHIYQVCTKNNVSIIRTMDYRTQHAELSFDEFLHVTNTSSCFFVFVVGAWHEDEAELTRKRHTHTCCTGWRPRDLGEGGGGWGGNAMVVGKPRLTKAWKTRQPKCIEARYQTDFGAVSTTGTETCLSFLDGPLKWDVLRSHSSTV